MATILIIEDNHTNLDLMSYLLEHSGYRIISAMDGEQGLQYCEQYEPDLVICDIQIPKIHGLEVIRRLNESPRKIPVVAITAYAMAGDREKILASGCDGYISKPIQPENFVSQIESYLSRVSLIKKPLSTVDKAVDANDLSYKGSILIVDDNPVDLYLSEILIKSMQLKPILASSVKEAIELLNEKPDMILSDFHLGQQSALDFMKFLKHIPEWKAIPFIIISSSISLAQRSILSLSNQIEEIISRPIEPEKFIAVIERIWNKNNFQLKEVHS